MIPTFTNLFTKAPPTLWLACGIALAAILPRAITKVPRPAIVIAFSAACITAYFACVAYYAQSIVLADHTDPTFIITSALWGRGQPIYTALDSAARYALPYGPDPYIIDSLFQKTFGYTIQVSKFPPAASTIASLAILLWILKRETTWTTAFGATATAVLSLALFAQSSYWLRADPFLILFVSIGLAATRIRNRTRTAILFGLSMGCAADAKLHAILYFLPLLALVLHYRGPKPAIAAIILAIAVALLPFLIFPTTVSIHNYAQWLRLNAHHELFAISIASLLSWTLMLAFPCLIAATSFAMSDLNSFKQWLQKNRSILATLTIAITITLAPASKEGAGPHHLMPFIPIFAYLLTTLIADHPKSPPTKLIQSLTTGYLLAALLIATVEQAKIARYVYRHTAPAQAALADIHTAESQYPGQTIAMGYSDTDVDYFATYYRVQLAFDGNPNPLDAAALMDMAEAQAPLPQSTLDALKAGQIKIWLIPTNSDPFNMINFYPNHPVMFPPQFRQLFFEHYEKHPLGNVFDAWVYKNQ